MAPPSSKSARATLTNGLDKEVLQIVRKFQDDQPADVSSPLPSVSAIYRYIQASNSTLKRKPKQLLQNSIDRVLAVMMDDLKEESGGEDDEGDMDGMDVDVDDLTGKVSVPERSANFMNKSLIAAWGTNSSGTATPTANGSTTLGKCLSALAVWTYAPSSFSRTV